MEQLLEPFHASQDEIRVEVDGTASGWDGVATKLITMLAGGEQIDIAAVSTSYYPQFAELGQLLDMEGAQGKFHRDLLTAKQIDQGQNIDAQTAPRQKRPFQLPSKKLGIRALAQCL